MNHCKDCAACIHGDAHQGCMCHAHQLAAYARPTSIIPTPDSPHLQASCDWNPAALAWRVRNILTWAKS